METTYKDIAMDRAFSKKYHLPNLRRVLRKQKLFLCCPWCYGCLTTDKYELQNTGKTCHCGALLTDEGNSWRATEQPCQEVQYEK